MKTRVLTIALTIVTTTSFAQTPQLEWAKSMGNSTYNDEGKSIAVDNNGNVYTTGFYRDVADFDPGSGTFNLSSNGGGSDVFIQKLDANGDFVWAKSFGGASSESVNSIAVDGSGNVYTVGEYSGTIDVDPGAGITYLTSNGVSDYFIQKLDVNGDFVWAKSFGGTGQESANAISLDVNGNIYVAGQYGGTVDFDPGVGTFNLTASGSYEIYLQKLDANGNFVWAKSMGEDNTNVGSMMVDNNNVYVAGIFYGTGDFDPGAGTFDLTSNGSSDDFIQKLDTNGNFVWAKSFGGTSSDQIASLVVDANGYVYTTGFYVGTSDFDPGVGTFDLTSEGGADIFIQKLDANGNFVWAKSMGGSSSDVGKAIAVNSEGDIYTTGVYKGTSDFDPGLGNFDLTSEGENDIYIAKLDSTGNLAWAGSMGGSSGDASEAIVVGSDEAIYTTGFYANTVDFDPGVGVFDITSTGGRDIFVQKLKICTASQGIDTRTECSPFVWIDGNTYTANNTTAQDTIIGGAANGCDSIVTLNLTITTVDTSVTQMGINLSANELFATYQWLDCNNNYAPIPGATFGTYYVLSSGSFAVEVTYYGCVDTSSCYTVFATGITENTINNNVSVYPNPVKDQLTVTVENEKINSIKIIDVAGKTLKTVVANTTTINVAGLAKGVYFLQVQTDKGLAVKRFIKE